jgi:hypothetical protein
MPYYEIGTLGNWLYGPTNNTAAASVDSNNASASGSSGPQLQQKPWKVQHVMQLILQGVAFLHQNRILHR